MHIYLIMSLIEFPVSKHDQDICLPPEVISITHVISVFKKDFWSFLGAGPTRRQLLITYL